MTICKRVALATILAALCVASLTMSVAGATPDGKSGLNFFALDAGQYDIEVTFDQEVDVVAEFTKTYNPAVSSITWDTSGTWYDLQRVVVRLYTNSTTDNRLFRYVAGGTNQYYVNATLRYFALDGTMYFVNPDRVTFFDTAGNPVYNGALYYGATISNKLVNIGFVEFSFPLQSPFNGVLTSWRLENLVLTQGVAIYRPDNPNWEQMDYVPYSASWFEFGNSTNDYQDGYEDGYQAGALDAGGEPMQKWGAFLLAGVTGFFDFEIFPGMPLWGLLGVMVAIPLVLACLKYFAGG